MPRPISRRALLARLAALGGLAFLGLAGAGYATAVEPRRLRLTRHRLIPPAWPPGRRLRLALLADLHANARNMGETDIRSVVAQTNALDPDLVLLLGDYCSQDRGALTPEAVAGLLGGLRARSGTYAVLGNHDWWDERRRGEDGRAPTRTHRAFAAAGIPVLENAAVPVPGLPGLWVAGIESEAAPWAAGRRHGPPDPDRHRAERLAATLAFVPTEDLALLLAHEPDVFADIRDPRVALVASGHTHGGQVRLFGWSPWIPSRYGLRYAYGHVVETGRHLVVSAGLGSHFVAGMPLRVGIPPEIVLVEIGDGPAGV